MEATTTTAATFSSFATSRQNLSSSPCSLLLSRKKLGSANLKFKSPRSLSVRASSTSDSVVTLLDYGAGNVRSIRNALRHLGFSIKDVQKPGDILNADRLIFPGVGAFAPAMDVLNKTGMGEALRTYIENDRPFLGIYVLGYSYFSTLVRRMDQIPECVSEKGKDFLENDPKQRWTVEELLKHPFLDKESHMISTSSPSTVLDQRFWNSSEASKSHTLSTDQEGPFAGYSDSPADRIQQLAGDEFSSVPDWDTVDDGGWIEVRGEETEKRVGYGDENAMCVEETSSSQVVEEWISDQDKLVLGIFSYY